jgi:glutamate carboxypeptidase
MAELSSNERAVVERAGAEDMLDQVLTWSAMNSGSRNLGGLERMADVLIDAFSALPGILRLENPAAVEAVDAAGRSATIKHGRHLHLTVRPTAPVQLLFTGHMDTVYAADHPFQTGVWRDADTLNAPGAADMKGGLAVILHALIAFECAEAARPVGYDVMINSDEETGSLSSAALIAELAHGKAAALTYEPSALPDGTLAHARGGSGNYSLVVTGRSAHAGRNPQDGRNAIVAAAALALELKALEGAELTVNPAKIDGGSVNNVVPDHAVLRFNVRPRTGEAAEGFKRSLVALMHRIEIDQAVSIRLHGGISRPPKPVDARAQKLFDLVADASAALGRPLAWQPTGGVCDGNNIAACGVPVVDTMGVRGGAIHSPDEYLIVSSLAERAALSAIVLHRLAKGALA